MRKFHVFYWALTVLFGLQTTALSAQFFSKGVAISDATVVGREWHISSMTEDQPMLSNSGGAPRAVNCATLNGENTFVVEDGPNDGDGWTPDVRWFHIRNVSNYQYLTVQNATQGSAVVWGNHLGEANNEMWKQQFRLITTNVVGKYRLRSRLSQNGPDLILTVEPNGELKAKAPSANLANKSQQFGFNLAMPNPSQVYSLANLNKGHLLSDRGLTTYNTPVRHVANMDFSCFWNFKPVGDYYYIVNALTGQYLSNNGSTVGNHNIPGSELHMNTGPSQAAQWKVIRDGHTFTIRNRLNNFILSTYGFPEDGGLVYQHDPQLVNFDGQRWACLPAPMDAEPRVKTGDFQRIYVGMQPYKPCFIFGSSFKKGVCERMGLPADESFFPLIMAALTERFKSERFVNQLLQNFDLANPAHRAEVAFILRNYILVTLGHKPPGTLTPLENAALTHYQNRISALRTQYADALDAKWAEFSVSFGLNNGGPVVFGDLLDNLDASNFVWPGEYEMTTFQTQIMGEYSSTCKTFNLKNGHQQMGIKIVLLTEPFVAPGFAVLMNAAISQAAGVIPMAAFTVEPAAAVTSAAAEHAANLSVQAGQKASQLFMHAAGQFGNVITVVILASQIIAQEAIQAQEVADLEFRISQKIFWCHQPVSIYHILGGNNELDKTRLIADMDYMVGAPVEDGFEYNTNDNTDLYIPFSMNCSSIVQDIVLDDNGEVTLHAQDLVLANGICATNINSWVTPSTKSCTDAGFIQTVTVFASDGITTQTCPAAIRVLEKTPPVARCKNATLALGFGGNATLTPAQINDGSTDNCGFVGGMSLDRTEFDCSNVGQSFVTLTVSDAYSNTSTCTAVISIVDNTPPLAICRDATVEIVDGEGILLPEQVFDPNFSPDACAPVWMSLNRTTFNCFQVGGQATVTLTVSDISDNRATCTANVSIQGSIYPDAHCRDVVLTLDANHHATLTPEQVDDGSTDICGAPALLLSKTDFDCSDIGTTPVTLTVAAGWGAFANRTCTGQVTVTENVPPVATCRTVSLTLNENGVAVLTPEMADAGSTDNCGIASRSVNVSQFNCSTLPAGSPAVLTVYDASGNPATCSFMVMVTDVRAPSITCPANQTRNTDLGQCTAAVTYSIPTFSDNCTASVFRTGGLPSGSAFPKGVNMVEWKATDAAGLSSTCQFTITVADGQKPGITCPANLVKNTDAGQCSAVVTYASPTFSDNCTQPSLTRTAGLASGSAFPRGVNQVEWKATDAAGNSSVCSFTVTINDSQAPAITCPSNLVKAADAGQCTAIVNYATPAYSDNCSGAGLDHIGGGLSGFAFQKGVTSVVWQATDGAGLTSRCTFTITVNDTQAPTITCPGNQTKSTDPNLCTAITTYPTPTFTDNCAGGSTTLQSGLASGSAFPKGMTTLIWRATDAAGLTKTCSFKVTVNDNQGPTVTCPANQAITTNPNLCTAVATYTNATFTDNCTGGSVAKLSGLNSGSAFPKGVNNVVFRATDGAGNQTFCTMTVTVTDAQLPTVTCPANISVTGTTSSGACSAAVTYPTPAASDNCSLLSSFLLSGMASNSMFPAGVTTNVWKATDETGLTATCAFTVTVGCGTGANSAGSEVRSSELEDKDLTPVNRDLRLVPNPVTTEVQITIDGVAPEAVGTILLLDTQGRTVWECRNCTPAQVVDVAAFPAGLYFVASHFDGTVITKPLVVSRL